MISYLLLASILVMLIFVNIKLYKFDLLSPSLLYNFAMLASVICSIIGLISWNDEKNLSVMTVTIIILSVLFFNVGELVIRIIVKKIRQIKKTKVVNNDEKNLVDTNKVENWKWILQLLYALIVFVLVFSEVKRIAIIAGYKGTGLGDMIQAYRSTSILFTTKYAEAGVSINIVVAQLQKVLEVICYVSIYYFSSIFFTKDKKIKQHIFNIGIILVSILTSLIVGSRMQAIIYVLFFFIVLIIRLNKKYEYKNILKLFWKRILVGIFVGVAFFYILLPLTGRENNSNIIDYVSFYFGTPIPSLNRFINEPKEEPQVFGEETFRGFQTILFKLKISDYIQPISRGWESFYTNEGHRFSSNVYTSAKRYYFDFGIIGVMLLQFINGITMSLMYLLVKSRKSIFTIIIYAMYAYMIIDQVRDEYLFSTFIHINTIFKFVVLYIGLKILNTKFEWRKYEIKN